MRRDFGSFVCNILAGGGGKGEFRHLLEHLSPGTRAWSADLNANVVDWSKESQGGLDESVQVWFVHIDMQAVAVERDNVLIDFCEAQK